MAVCLVGALPWLEFFFSLFSPSLFSSLACSTRGGATMKNLTMAILFQIQRVCHKAQICHFFQITIRSLIGKKLRYEQKVASLEYPLRCGLTLKPSLCGIYLLTVLIMAVLSCALCFTETSMNFQLWSTSAVWKLRLLAAPLVASTGSLRLTY